MARQRRPIILLFAVLWLMSAARADGAERMTAARQDYAYDPRAGAVTLDLTTVYSGIDAGRFRDLYQRLGRDGYGQAKLDYYRGMYGAVAETAPLTIKDNPDRDAVETHERYTVTLAKSKDEELKHRFPIYPDLLRGFFAQLPPMIRQSYALDGTLDRHDIVTVTAPTLGTYTIGDGGVADRYFAFTRKATAGPGRVEMDYRLRFLTDSVPVADFAGYSADIERMDHNIFAWIDLDRDFSHRYYRDIPKIIRGVAAAVLLGAGAWWFWRRRRAGRA